MEKLQLEPQNWVLRKNRRDIKRHWKPRLHYPVFVYLSFLVLPASSPLWCTSSTAAPAPVPSIEPPAASPVPPQSPTHPDTIAALYSLTKWPDVWRQGKGNTPNITDLTAPRRDPCSSVPKWIGINCDGGAPFQHITEIIVTDLQGGYPLNFLSAMSNITSLRTLSIYQNGDNGGSSLSGSIPASLGKLENLTTLNFRGNQLTGEVPVEVARLPKLNYLNLADNQLTGPIEVFCESKSLQKLLLFNNSFTQSIPSCLGRNLINLTTLNLGINNLTGSIPDSFLNLINLESLNLDTVAMPGGLNNTLIAAYPRLTLLSCRQCNLSGSIPEALGSLKGMTSIQLGQNELSGAIPPSLGNLDSLVSLALYENKLSGEIPPELGGMKNLTRLLLANNSLSGSLDPSSLGRLTNLRHLHLQGNEFSGPIPGQLFANLTDLRGLFLQENRFSGPFPSREIYRSCPLLAAVSVSYNNLNGPVLEPGATLPVNLSFLLMSYNNFSGSIPRAILGDNTTNYSSLQYLDLANNSLTGEVPLEITSKAGTNSVQINLSFNSLNVSKQPTPPSFALFNCLPQDMATCREFQAGTSKGIAINVGGTEYKEYIADIVTPELPIGMYRASNSSTWSFSTTGVDGAGILNSSQALTNADSIENWHNLYNSARTGADSFTYYIHSLQPGKYKVSLGFVELVTDMRPGERVFDIWIQGELVWQGMDVVVRAQGHNRAFVEDFEVETSAQLGLLTIELRGHGSWPLVFNKRVKQGQYYGPTLSVLRVHPVEPLVISRARVGIIVGATAGVAMLTLLALCIASSTYLKRRRVYRKLQASIQQSGLGLKFFGHSELEAATSKWSEANLLGEGAFGKVYKGILADGTSVAIKQLTTKAEGPLCSKESFLNEARIISSTRHRNLIALLGCCLEAPNPIFICEFMPNGSLHDVLFVHRIALDWASRVAIAKDVASGLLYLHEETSHRIIHRDVKPANILLDSKFNARVADFGLARLVSEREIDVVTNVMGTRGYLAPEYALNGLLSDKVDVFSYGVVLLELVSGRHGMQISGASEDPDRISMAQWAWEMHMTGQALAIADPALGDDFDNEDFIRMVELALWCTQNHPHMRPNMSQVYLMLQKQAHVPKLTRGSWSSYEPRDFQNLPATTPFSERKWTSYVSTPSEANAGMSNLDGCSSTITNVTSTSNDSFYFSQTCQDSWLCKLSDFPELNSKTASHHTSFETS